MSDSLDKRFIGTVMMVSTAVFFSFMALFVRLASETIPVGMIVFTRYIISTAVFMGLFLVGILPISPVNRRLLLYRSLAASFGGVFYFFAVSTITIGEAVILKYTYPLFAVTIAVFLFGEKTGRTVLILLIMCIVGVVIMMNPLSFNPHFGYIYGLLTGLCAGGAVAFARKLRETDNSSTIMFFTSLTGIFVSMPFLSDGLIVPDIRGLVWMLAAAVCGIAAQFSLVYGIRYINTGSACVIIMIEVVMSAFLGFVILGQTLTPSQILGGLLILAGGVVLTVREGQMNRSVS